MKLMKNKKYLQLKFSRRVLVSQTTADFTSRVIKSYVPFTCKFRMVMHFVPLRNKRCRSKTNVYERLNDNVFSILVFHFVVNHLLQLSICSLHFSCPRSENMSYAKKCGIFLLCSSRTLNTMSGFNAKETDDA